MATRFLKQYLSRLQKKLSRHLPKQQQMVPHQSFPVLYHYRNVVCSQYTDQASWRLSIDRLYWKTESEQVLLSSKCARLKNLE